MIKPMFTEKVKNVNERKSLLQKRLGITKPKAKQAKKQGWAKKRTNLKQKMQKKGKF